MRNFDLLEFLHEKCRKIRKIVEIAKIMKIIKIAKTAKKLERILYWFFAWHPIILWSTVKNLFETEYFSLIINFISTLISPKFT